MIPQANPGASHQLHTAELEEAFRRVLASGNYILGQEVRAFEDEFAAYIGVGNAIGVASGTEALECALRAAGVESRDVVVTVSLSAVATASAIQRIGATPLFVDVEERTLTMDPNRLDEALTGCSSRGSLPKAIIPVHLYGCPADMPAIGEVARRYGIVVIEDCAQAHGADIEGRKVGRWGELAAFSFFPTKNLGGLGDGGMVVTDDPILSEQARRIRQYGWDAGRVSQRPGMNSRLDELQAALLRVKLTYLNEENQRRRERAEIYRTLLDDIGIDLPVEPSGFRHVYHQFVVRTPSREGLRRWLLGKGVKTGVHYPVPIHQQPAFANSPEGSGGLSLTERMATQVLSLPIFPQLDIQSVQQVATAIRDWHTIGCP